MEPDEELKPTARKIEQAAAKDTESIPLDQPFPEELDQPQPPEPKPEEKPDKREKEKQEDEKPNENKESEEESANDSEDSEEEDKEPTLVAGYEPAELITAPIKPPEPTKTESRRATRSNAVQFLVVLGILLFILGIVFILTFSALLGIIIVLIGGTAIIASVFIPFRK